MPGLNEEDSVESAVRRVMASLERLTTEYEIIIIDDGSTDQTGPIAERMAVENDRIRVIRNEKNVNYGISLCRGIKAATCEWILHDGMDLPLAPDDFDKFIPLFDDADVIVARRIDKAAHSPWRRVTSWTNNLLLRILFAPRSTDLNFVQFYRRSFVQNLNVISTSPAFVTPEIILTAERTRKRVREVSVEFQKRYAGKAHFGKFHDIAWTLKDMFRLRWLTLLRGWQE
jgi:glycosyltransferase involved in cell wall biosynthesis